MKARDILSTVMGGLLFSTIEVASKMVGNALDAVQMVFFRFFFAGLFMLPFALSDIRRKKIRITAGDFAYLFLISVANISLGMSLFHQALHLANANLVAIISSSSPVFTMIFAHFAYRDRINRQRVLILVLSIAGLLLVANPLNLAAGNTPAGVACAMGACVLFGLSNCMSQRAIARVGNYVLTSFNCLFGSLVVLFFLIFRRQPLLQGINAGNIGWILYVGVAATGIGYYFYYRVVEACGASASGVVFFIKPIFASLLAFAVFHEAITWNIVLGMALILTGAYINMKMPRGVPAAAETQ